MAARRHSKAVRWGHLYEIDYRTRVDSEAWHKRHPLRIKHLSSWRNLHRLAPHETVSSLASRSPSSDITLNEKIMLGKLLQSARDDAQAEQTVDLIAKAAGLDLKNPPPSLF